MPRILLISDIHGNIEALEAVAERLKEEEFDRAYCLGDFVGYGPNPNEVIEKILAMEESGIEMRFNIGNHDGAAIGKYEFVNIRNQETLERVMEEGVFESQLEIIRAYKKQEIRKYIPVKADAEETINWTIERMTDPTREFLTTRLEDRIEIMEGVISVHASPRDVSFEYIRDDQSALKVFESDTMNNVKICFHAHTHFPVVWSLPAEERMSYGGSIIIMGEVSSTHEELVRLDSSNLYLINVGSVGQPRGEDRRPTYVIYDSEAMTVQFRRVEYDSSATIKKIQEAGLSDDLVSRLLPNDVVEVDDDEDPDE
jgi:predicted phosphodiesterase